MNTRAGMKIGSWVTPGITGIAFMLSSAILKLKGYRIVGQIPFDMPSNWISIHPALRGRAVEFIHEKNYIRAAWHFDRLAAGSSIFLSRRGLVYDMQKKPLKPLMA